MFNDVSNFFGKKFLLPKILFDCKIINSVNGPDYPIGKVYLFEKNIYQSVYLIEKEYNDEIVYVGTSITGYFKVKEWKIDISSGVDIIGKSELRTEMIIKNIFITRNSRIMNNNQYNNYIRFVASKIVPGS